MDCSNSGPSICHVQGPEQYRINNYTSIYLHSIKLGKSLRIKLKFKQISHFIKYMYSDNLHIGLNLYTYVCASLILNSVI